MHIYLLCVYHVFDMYGKYSMYICWSALSVSHDVSCVNIGLFPQPSTAPVSAGVLKAPLWPKAVAKPAQQAPALVLPRVVPGNPWSAGEGVRERWGEKAGSGETFCHRNTQLVHFHVAKLVCATYKYSQLAHDKHTGIRIVVISWISIF